FQLVDQLGAIVKAGTVAPAGETVATGIACVRRRRQRPCPGFILVNRVDVPMELQWLCPECRDEGVIRNFRGTLWDIGLGAPPRSADEPVVVARLSPAEYWTVRQIRVL